ncbi:MAG TPA: sigma-70 family RNA polymerase sigma factor [Oculatellaceae cyanobacterium]
MNLFKLFSTDEPTRAVEQWVKRYSSEFYRFAKLRVNSAEEAEDILQQTFAKAYKGFSTFTPGTNERAWLYAILNNAIKDHLVKRSRRPLTVELPDADFLYEAADSRNDPEAQLSLKMDLERLSEGLSALPEPFVTPLLMHTVGGMKYDEIAKTLSIPVGTVMSRLYRARKALFEMLADNEEREQSGSVEKPIQNTRGGEKHGLR